MIDTDAQTREREIHVEQIAIAEEYIADPATTEDERTAARGTIANHRAALAAMPVPW